MPVRNRPPVRSRSRSRGRPLPRAGRTVLAAVTALAAGSLVLAGTLPATAAANRPAAAPAKGKVPRAQVPPVDGAALRQAIAGLPDEGITGALVRVAGSAGGWRGASGTADLATGRPATPDAPFRVGSVTKAFTATVVLQLAAEHRLDLSGTVQHYLPGVLPSGIPPVTVAELLDHTSGLPGGSADDGEGAPALFVAERFGHPTPAQVVAEMAGKPMSFAPGTAQQYNGENYYLLGMLVEKVTGRSYATEVTDRILRPLRLTDTRVPDPTDYRVGVRPLHGYLAVSSGGSTRLADVTEQSPYPWAEGGMVSSARDLSTFMTALIGGRLLPPAQRRDLFTVPDVPYVGTNQCQLGNAGRACFGLGGLMRQSVYGVTVWGKTGSRPGYTDGVFATPDLARVLVYAFTPTDENGAYNDFILGIAHAALT